MLIFKIGANFAERGKFMFLKSISVVNFRNYDNLELELSPNVNIIYGDNAQGKTNLLESIYFLAMTKSHRSFIDDNLIREGEKIAKIDGLVSNDDFETNLRIVLSTASKKMFVDGNNYKKVSDYVSRMNVIIFYPEDLELVKGGPLVRRRYINLELSQLYSNYMDILNDYKKLIKIKGNYLKGVKSGNKMDDNYYFILNEYIIKRSVPIYIMRKKFIDKINMFASSIFFDLSGTKGFNIRYKTSINMDDVDSDRIGLELREQSKLLLSDEIKMGKNLLGPSFDDFEFYIDDMNIKKYGSQGQQRMAVLAIKLSEIEIFKNYLNTSPILLLDDVFSELDSVRKNNLLKYVDSSVQTIITSTDLDNIDSSIVERAKLFNIKNGKVERC